MSANIPNDPVAIQRFFTSRDNNADAATYVGQEQRLWYDPTTNAIYVSDGNTAGGVMVGAGGSGNGVAGGPTNSIQYNAGGGAFGGTANLIISGNGVSVVGNVTSAYFIGNGSQLTDLPVQPGTYGNANVADYLPTYTGNLTSGEFSTSGNAVANGNVTGGNFSTSGNVLGSGNFSVTGNAFASNFSTTGNISAGGNISLDGNVSVVGNTTSAYFIGDGSQLTNVPSGASNKISNGNSYANIASADGNLVINVSNDGYGLWTFETGTGNLIGPGNATQGAGIVLSADQNVYIREDMGQLNIDAVSNIVITSNSGNTGNTKSWNFDPTGNLTAPGNINAVGNITGNYFIGNGSQLTGLPAGNYSNSNVATFLGDFGSNAISTSGNITASGLLIDTVTGITSNAGNININQITGLGGYLNAFGANLLGNINAVNLSLSGNIISDANISGNVNAANISAGNISLSGNIFAYGANIYSVNGLTMEGGNLIMSSITGMGGSISAEGNIISANLSATGNVSGQNINGDNLSLSGNVLSDLNIQQGNISVLGNITSGSELTVVSANITGVQGLTVSGGDITIPSSMSGGSLSAYGNITGNYIKGDGSQLTSLPVQPGTYGNSNVATFLGTFGSNAISTSGNITGNFFIGDGSQLTNLPVGNYSNTNVAAYLTTANISTTGNIDANNIATGLITITDLYSPNFYSNAVIYSNSAGYISSTNLFKYNPGTGTLTVDAASLTGNVTANYFIGDGSQLTGLPVQPGTYSNSNVATFLGDFGSNAISTSGNITGNFFIGDGSQLTNLPTGNYSNSNVATFLGDFGSNAISTSGNITGNFFIGNLATPTYGSFFDTTTQTNSNVGNAIPMSYNTTDINNGVTANAAGNTQITISDTGIYNIQFSAQLNKTSGGANDIYIWLDKNGTAVANSATAIYLTGNNAKAVAAWNFVVDATAGDYYRLMWQSASADVQILAQAAADGVPDIPSVILTVVPVGA